MRPGSPGPRRRFWSRWPQMKRGPPFRQCRRPAAPVEFSSGTWLPDILADFPSDLGHCVGGAQEGHCCVAPVMPSCRTVSFAQQYILVMWAGRKRIQVAVGADQWQRAGTDTKLDEQGDVMRRMVETRSKGAVPEASPVLFWQLRARSLRPSLQHCATSPCCRRGGIFSSI
jgi:hypothetical protein